MAERKRKDPKEPFNKAPEDIQGLIRKVLKAEQDKIFMDRPEGINEELLQLIRNMYRT